MRSPGPCSASLVAALLGPASGGARRTARTIASILAGCMILAASKVHGQSVEGFPPAQHDRVVAITHAAVTLLSEWLGPPPFGALTVRGTPAPASTAAAGVAEVQVHWLVFERDRSLERSVIAAISRQFWAARATSAPLTPFQEAMNVYTGTRAMHQLLEGSNFLVVRFFGGIIPFPLRSVLLSPPVADPRPRVWQFDELPASSDAIRLVRGLQTIERYVGWPTMAQALAASRANGIVDAHAFAATLSAVRGTDIIALVQECFRPDATFDYAIDEVRSAPAGKGLYESSVTLRRTGSGVFAVGGDEDREPSMPVLLRFADGTELRDWFDGAVPSASLVYTAKSPVVYSAVDPDMVLLLDVNRSNNTFATQSRIRPLGVRLALHWMAWLQHTMLAYSALV